MTNGVLTECLTGIRVPDFDGDLTCTLADDSEFPMRTPGWCVIELTELWGEGDVVGDFVDVASIVGQLAQPIYPTGSRYDLDLLVTGAVLPDATYTTWTPATDPWAGLESNLEELRQNVLTPTMTGDGTRPFTLTMPSAAERTAQVTVQPRLDLSRKYKWVHLYTLTLTVAAGRFAA